MTLSLQHAAYASTRGAKNQNGFVIAISCAENNSEADIDHRSLCIHQPELDLKLINIIVFVTITFITLMIETIIIIIDRAACRLLLTFQMKYRGVTMLKSDVINV